MNHAWEQAWINACWTLRPYPDQLPHPGCSSGTLWREGAAVLPLGSPFCGWKFTWWSPLLLPDWLQTSSCRDTFHCLLIQNSTVLIFLPLSVSLPCNTSSLWSLKCHSSPKCNYSLQKVRDDHVPLTLFPSPSVVPGTWRTRETVLP